MIDVKDYITSKRFGVISYVCLIVHFLFGVVLTAVTNEVRKGEFVKFSCAVDTKITAAYKTYVEKTCYSRYEDTYNSPLPLYGFVLLSFGLQVFVSVIYSLVVSSRVDEIADRTSNGSEEPRTDGEEKQRGFYVFYFYFFHLVARSLFGIVFTILQYTVFYPSGFHFKFSCRLPSTKVTSQIPKNSSVAQSSVALITCENSTASEKELWGIIVSILNTVFALIILGELIYLWRRFPIFNRRSEYGWSRDTEFVTVHFLRKRYTPVDVEQTIVDNDTPSQSHSTRSDSSSQDSSIGDTGLAECLEFYKQQVLHPCRTSDICYAPETDLDHVYIDVVIHTGRAPHKFSKEMDRHEIYDVYMEVPQNSIRLEEVKDLFYPNKDTKGESPRTILAVGRPGIGKTALTEKVIHDWANGIDKFYHGKIAFYVKFRWFSSEALKSMSLKTFLRYGTGLSEEKFESFFEEISDKPDKAILIFDGLDEFDGDFMKCFDQARMLSSDHNTPMFPMTLFIKLAFGNMLHGATILVTSRPTADEFYSKLHFERSVEIIGFTSEKIEEYVSRFCNNKNVSDLKPKIWNHIKSSSDLLNLCYIPVNCYIVCVTLSGCLINSNNDTGALPTTMTALYQTAVDHLAKRHNRNLDKVSSEEVLTNLQNLAFDGMENERLIFDEKNFNEQMKKSGLLNSLTNPVSPLETLFCFLHLTVQEFLAAKHVVETLARNKVKKFICTHIESGKWHLVLQFIAGLLGEKIKMSGSDYQDCVLAYAKSLTLRNGVINIGNYGHVFVMKCLREVDDVRIVKNICGKTDLSNARTLLATTTDSLSLSDWVAATFVCKHLNNLINLDLKLFEMPLVDIYFREVCELVQHKCFETLILRVAGVEMERLIWAMTNLECTLNHEHAKLRKLEIYIGLKDAEVSSLCTFIKNGHAGHLQVLTLRLNHITSSGIFELSEVFNNGLCSKLTYLDVGGNMIGDEGVRILCNALIQGHCKMNTLTLNNCSLTAECMRSLSEVLCDEHCKLTELELGGNDIGDEGVRMLCTDVLGKEQCKLARLRLGGCLLTGKSARSLSEVLCNEHCKLTALSLDDAIGDEGLRMLCTDALRIEQCKLTELSLCHCRFTDQCVPLLCESLQDRNCRLVKLAVFSNNFTEQGKSLLHDVEEVEICKARGLKFCRVNQGSMKKYFSG